MSLLFLTSWLWATLKQSSSETVYLTALSAATCCCHTGAPIVGIKQVKLKVLVAQSRPTLSDPMDCSLPGPSVHGILQARILEWVAMPSSRGIFPTQGSILGLPQCSQTLYHLSTRPKVLEKRRALYSYDQVLNSTGLTSWVLTCTGVGPVGRNPPSHHRLREEKVTGHKVGGMTFLQVWWGCLKTFLLDSSPLFSWTNFTMVISLLPLSKP